MANVCMQLYHRIAPAGILSYCGQCGVKSFSKTMQGVLAPNNAQVESQMHVKNVYKLQCRHYTKD